jgi:hypothetical protein
MNLLSEAFIDTSQWEEKMINEESLHCFPSPAARANPNYY